MKVLNILITILLIGVLVSCTNSENTSNENLTEEKNVTIQEFPACPRGMENEEFPGSCYLYQDTNNNKICDLSE